MTFTRDEIMAMSADELRIEIAKKEGFSNFDDRFSDGEGVLLAKSPNSYNDHVPDYPHDIAAAWELVEEMARNGMLVTFQISRNVVSILVNTPIFDGSETIRVNDISASTTISRAWLIWSEEMGK